VRFDVREGLLRRLKGRIHAVEGVSFSIAPGETIGLVGESGSGKSTIGRTIVRLEIPTSGHISIDGHAVERLDRNGMRPVRRLVQMVFQDPFASLNPRLEVGSQVAEPLVVHNIGNPEDRRDHVAELFRRVGLSPQMQHRFPHEFSGGQRQRLCIARALALRPKLIVADEAVSALDVTIQMQVLNLFLDLQAAFNLSYLFISHDISVIKRIAHRVAVMHMGRIVEIGPCRAVLTDPRHPYTQRLLSAVLIADPRCARSRPAIVGGEVKSPIQSVGWVAPKVRYSEVSPKHFVALDA
jgi:peptide/nickel transport system ATP-binding protein